MDINEEQLKKMSKEELVEFVMSNKHKLIQNKDKNVPFVDKDGKVHRKEYAEQQAKKSKKKKMDFSKVKTIRIAFKFSYMGKDYSGLVV